MKDHAHTLSDFRVPTLSIECEPCGRFGRYNIAKLIEQHGDAKLPELLYVLADCPFTCDIVRQTILVYPVAR